MGIFEHLPGSHWAAFGSSWDIRILLLCQERIIKIIFPSVKGSAITSSFDFSNKKLVKSAIKSGEMKAFHFMPSILLRVDGISQKGKATPIKPAKLKLNSDCSEDSLVSESTCSVSPELCSHLCQEQHHPGLGLMAWPVGCTSARVLCSAQHCLGKSVEEALVASQALVSVHPMFIFRSFLLRENYAWESSGRKWGLRSLEERLEHSRITAPVFPCLHFCPIGCIWPVPDWGGTWSISEQVAHCCGTPAKLSARKVKKYQAGICSEEVKICIYWLLFRMKQS